MKKDIKTPLLKVENLSVDWEGEPVLSNTSFSVYPGERVCIFGRSGVGKSTLLHAIAGLNKPSSGRVLLAGCEDKNGTTSLHSAYPSPARLQFLHDAAAHQIHNSAHSSGGARSCVETSAGYCDITGEAGFISYMFQSDLLFDQKTVLQNCSLPLIIEGTPRKEAEQRVQESLATFGLAEVADSYPQELSGGMRQRAALLRTSLMGNKVVLMDEPFSALDAFTKADLQQFFLQKAQELELTILFVSHDLAEAEAFGTRALVLVGNPQAGVSSNIIADTYPEKLVSYLN